MNVKMLVLIRPLPYNVFKFVNGHKKFEFKFESDNNVPKYKDMPNRYVEMKPDNFGVCSKSKV